MTSTSVYTFSGHNNLFRFSYLKRYYPEDHVCASYIRDYRCQFGYSSPFEDIINHYISCV